MFRGNHPAKVDEKGRLKLPADYKRLSDETYGADTKFYVTSKDGKRAEIYPMREWEAVEAKLAPIPMTNPAKKKFLDVTNYYGQVVEADGQGRILLPQILRESASLKSEVVVLGFQTYLEVADMAGFTKEQPALTIDDLNDLSGLGI